MPTSENGSIGSRDSESGAPIPNEDIFKPKAKPKAIRVLTVLAYILSVSMAAILLSIYYIFMWRGSPHIGAQQVPPYEMLRSADSTFRFPEESSNAMHNRTPVIIQNTTEIFEYDGDSFNNITEIIFAEESLTTGESRNERNSTGTGPSQTENKHDEPPPHPHHNNSREHDLA